MSRVTGLWLLIALLQLSCGEGDSLVIIAGGAPPAGGASASWMRVHEEFFNDAVTPQDCEYPWKFTVQNTGAFTAGPCVSGGEPVLGTLAASELSQLDELAAGLIAGDYQAQSCESSGAIVADFVELTLVGGTTFRAWERNVETQELCYRDGRDSAQALHEFVHALARKYYPLRTTDFMQ